MLYYGGLYTGPVYDAALHAFFVGYVMSMIFGHAPIIFPRSWAELQFSSAAYVPVGLLHASLVLRVVGDLWLQLELRKWGGLLNEGGDCTLPGGDGSLAAAQELGGYSTLSAVRSVVSGVSETP